MVVMGGSGSGKSTLLRHLLALEHATSGSIKLLGKELGTASAMDLYELRKKMGGGLSRWRIVQLHDGGREHHTTPARAHRSGREHHEHHGQIKARGC